MVHGELVRVDKAAGTAVANRPTDSDFGADAKFQEKREQAYCKQRRKKQPLYTQHFAAEASCRG